MKLRRLLAAACAVVIAIVSPRASLAQLGDAPRAEQLVHASSTPVSIAAGSGARTTVHITIEPGWHMNANPPALDYLIPTKLSVAPAFGVRGGAVKYPAGKSLKLSFEDQPLLVYDGAVDVELPLEAAPKAVNGEHVLKGTVAFQACNDEVCLAPAKVPFEVKVTVTGGLDAGAEPVTDSVTAVAVPADSAAPADTASRGAGFTSAAPTDSAAASVDARGKLNDALARGGLGWFLALFVGGLLLNLTPCVFPMLGITVSIFGARRKAPLAQVLGLAVVYVLGIGVMYSLLGVVAALSGSLFGAALQNPLVNVGLGVVLFALAMSMFGFYEMQAPTWVLDKLGGQHGAGVLGTFLSGLAVGVVAAPCVGPFVIAVLALIAQRGDAAFGFQTMFAMSLGLGAPYVVLAAFSNLLQQLPRSGDWMGWVKKLFGVILSSVALFYVCLGLAPKQAPWVMPAALLLGGLYLGFMEKSGNAVKAFRRVKQLVGLVAVAAGVWMVLQFVNASSRTMAFQKYDEGKVAASLKRGRHVMLDFSADWCVPCHELELQTFTDAAVIAAVRGDFDTYKVDLTRYDAPESEALRKQYAITGVPTIVFLAPGGDEVPGSRVEGFLPPERFLQRVQLGAAAK